jgi:uncharacterized protein YndB with AHSA1/START domain
MPGMRATQLINRPIEDVFAFFLNLERTIMATDPKVASVRKVTEGPVGPGTTYVISQPVFGRVREQRTVFTAVEPNQRIEFEARFGPVAPRLSLTFEQVPSGTEVTLTGDSRPVGPFRVVTGLMDRIGERNWVRRLGLIKDVMEKT